MRVLVIGDVHAPADHPMYMKFCKDLHKKYKCNKVVFVGDLVDWHAISFHSKHPELPGSADEYELARKCIGKWYKAFPKAKVCIGNHDRRPVRLAENSDIPEFLLRKYDEIWGTPGWEWDYEFVIDSVSYWHGECCSGINPAYTRARGSSISVVIGHVHSAAGVKWIADKTARRFGMDVGCGIDIDKMQFAYGKHFQARPILSAGVVINGVPHHEVMPCDVDEKYHKSKANKRRE